LKINRQAKSANFNNGESGSALVITLCILVLVALLAASAVTMSQLCLMNSRTLAERTASSYIAESALSDVIWSIMQDRSKFTSRALGELKYAELEEERFMADGTMHLFDDENSYVSYSISDAASGIDASAASLQNSLMATCFDDKEKQQKLMETVDLITDYTDADDFVRLKGMEKVDYESAGLSPLPRNDKLQYRGELLLIPRIEEFVNIDEYGRLSFFNLVSPPGMPKLPATPGLFGSSIQTIASRCNFKKDDSEKVAAALDAWKKNKTPLSESLDPSLLGALKSRFSMNESGFYTIIIKASSAPGLPARSLIVSLKIDSKIPEKGLAYLEYLLY